MVRGFRGLLAPFVCLLVACGGGDGVTIDDPDAAASFDGAPRDATVPDATVPDATVPDAGGPIAAVSPSSLDFGLVDCAGAAVDKIVTIRNLGGSPLAFRAELSPSAALALVEPSSGSVAPGATGTLTVRATIDGGGRAGAIARATLTVSTDDPAHASSSVDVAATAAGASFTLVPSSASFGVVSLGATGVLGLMLTNTGNRAAKLHATTPGDPAFGLTWQGAPADVTIAPGDVFPGLTATFAPASTTSAASSVSLVPSGPVCGDGSVSTIAMSGVGTSGTFAYSPQLLDFGQTSCGATASAKTVTITNSGSQTFTWTATLGQGASSPYTLSFTNTTVAAGGGTGTLTVTPKRVPSTSSTATDGFGDAVTIDVVAGIPNEPTHTVLLTQTAKGAVLRFVQSTPISFGDTPLTTTANAPFAVENTGNAPATVTASITGGPVFGLTASSLGAIGPSGSAGGTATFTPKIVGAQNAQLGLATLAGDVLCSPIPAPLSASGRGTNGAISLSASSLDFGAVDCGRRTAAKTITVRNTGTNAFTWSASLATGTSYTLATTNTTLAPAGQAGDTGTLTVTPGPIPQASATTADLYADTVTVTTTIVGDTPHAVPLHMTAHGAILAASTTDVELGGVVATTSASAQLSVTNSGNASAPVTFTTTDAAFTVTPRPGVVVPSTSTTFTVTFSPSAQKAYVDQATFTVGNGTALCAPLPAPIALGGTGTPPTVDVAPTNLDFSRVACGGTALPLAVTIRNEGAAAMGYTAALTSGAAFYTLGSTSGTIAPGGSFDLVVTPAPIPAVSLTTADLYAGQVTVTTDSPGDTAHVISLHETAQGVRLAWDVAQLDFGTVTVGSSSSLPLVLTNSGNLTANVSFAGYATPPFAVTPGPGPSPVVGGQALPVTATFSPTAPGATSGQTVTVSASEVLCAPLPAAIPISATGQ